MENKIKKEFDAVKMMREIRENLSKEYANSPIKEKDDLKIIREKYNIKRRIEIAS